MTFIQLYRTANRVLHKALGHHHQEKLRLFSLSDGLEFIEIDIFGPIPKTRFGNQSLLEFIDRYMKLEGRFLLLEQLAHTSRLFSLTIESSNMVH